jgi:indolepyruvate ferredoxin oxidoreductase
MMDSFMPVLSPAGVQEVMDYGLFGFALSRFAGVWAGLKCIKDTIEVTSVVNGDPQRLQFVTPEFDMPDGGLNIRLIDTPQEQEARIIHHKRRAVQAFARANRMDKRVLGTGWRKNWLCRCWEKLARFGPCYAGAWHGSAGGRAPRRDNL